MNDTRKFADDPKLTAYALGELEGAERAAIEARLRDDPAAQAAVEEIRAAAAQLSAALADEPVTSVATPAAADPYKPVKRGVLSFPQIYYVVGGLAAACLAVVVALHEPPARVAPKMAEAHYVSMPMNLPVAAGPVDESPGITLPQSVVPEGATSAAPPPGPFDLTRGGLIEQAKKMPGRSAPLLLAADASADEARRVAAMQRAEEAQAKARSAAMMANYTPAASLAGTRLRTEMREVGSALTVVSSTFAQDIGAMTGRYGGGGNGAEKMSTENYAYRRDNDFLSARENPLSTFSADVDTASYANLRRFIVDGRRPPVDAVRIEEMLNYFPYRYAGPEKGRDGGVAAPFTASIEVAEAPWAAGHRLVRIGLKAREVATPERAPANLVFLLDVSGSMNAADKLPLVKESLRLLLGRLRPDDRVAVVTYAGSSGLALPSTPVAKAREIEAAIAELAPAGSTNGAMGIHLAYDIAKANFVTGGINRVILCTDGDFNVGTTSEGELVRLIEEKAKTGVFLTVLGFGMGNLKDATLQQIANRGNGSYGYVDTRREAEKLLVEQVSGTLVTVAKDVKLQVEFNPGKVSRYRLIGYEKRLLAKEDFNNDKVDAGEIGAGHTVTALYEIVPVGAENGRRRTEDGEEVDALKYAVPEAPSTKLQAPHLAELLTLKVRYKEPAGDVSRKLEFPLTDGGAAFAEASEDFKFAAAVAGFGMLLRDSMHKGDASFAAVRTWAEAGIGADAGGYRAEFVDLVRRAEALQ